VIAGGREVLVRLALPLPLDVATGLMRAVDVEAKRLGYTDIVLLTDGSGGIAGTPPANRRTNSPV
jgi:hypothetical protein